MNQQNNNEISFNVWRTFNDTKMIAVFQSSDDNIFHVMDLKSAKELKIKLEKVIEETESS